MTPLPATPTHIETSDGTVNILQLTDPHLYLDTSVSTAGINNHHSFMTCLQQALSENRRCDLILLTGDLVNEVKPEIYDRIYQTLGDTGIDFACIAGNHDVTDELGLDLPFEQRQFVPHQPDKRLLSRHSINLNNWQLLLIDSSVPGQIFGEIDNTTLDWLRQKVQASHNPVIITMHHHVHPMDSAWIDAHMVKNTKPFWRFVEQHSNIKAIVSGHVHQSYAQEHGQVKVYTTPSTCYQFLPKQDDFAIDSQARPGYRWLALHQDGTLDSWVTRLKHDHLSDPEA